MKTLFSLVFAFAFFLSVGWYVTYKNNPNKVCMVHPDKAKAEFYYYCWPGFDLPVDSFIDGNSPVEREKQVWKSQNRKKALKR